MAIDGEDGDGSFMFGPGPMGSFFNFSPDSAALTPGTFFAPTVVDAFALADREWKTAIGDVVAATELRRG